MDGFSQYCDPSPCSSGSLYSPLANCFTENLLMSDAGTGTTISCTDEDIMLASSHPKKRAGRKKFKETRHPVYRGVRMRNSTRWVCEVREPNKRNRIWLGTYPTAEMAARAHDVAALALRGLKGCLNFADSAWRLPKPASNDPEDIQRAAAEAAAMFSIDEEDESADDNLDKESSIMTTSTVSDDAYSITDHKNYEPLYDEQFQQSGYYYMDDESIFDMPRLLNDMAEGMLLPAPSYLELESESTWDINVEDDGNMMLWNHSI